jgi:hypothetical protein
LELTEYDFDIVYRKGKTQMPENKPRVEEAGFDDKINENLENSFSINLQDTQTITRQEI